MTQIIAAFISGFFLCLAISLVIHRRHKQAWQAEYRRLMGGIDGALIALYSSNRPRINHAIKILSETYRGE